jgi:DNA-binding MarR family transcriptional regulator
MVMARRSETGAVLGVLQDLWALAHALQARSKWMHRSHGITGPRRLVLRIVDAHPGCTHGEVARQLHLAPGTVTKLVDGLEGLGLLRRTGDRRDRRRVLLKLTPRGERVAALRTGTVEEAVRAAVKAARTRDLASARTFIAELTQRLLRRSPLPAARGGNAPRPIARGGA